MKISIITATYNSADTISACIDSLAVQSYADIEHIIIDGNSIDNTLDKIYKKKQNVIVLSEPDKGMYSAINKGLRLATGDIIGLLHSDDEVHNEAVISTIANFFQTNQYDVIYANGIFVNRSNPSKVIRNWISGKYSQYKLYFGWIPLHTTLYMRKSVLEKVGYYNEEFKIAGDYDYTLRLFKTPNLKIGYLNQYTVRMKMGGASTSIATQFIKSKEDLAIIKEYKLWGILTLAFKIVRKIPQFF